MEVGHRVPRDPAKFGVDVPIVQLGREACQMREIRPQFQPVPNAGTVVLNLTEHRVAKYNREDERSPRNEYDLAP